MTNVFPVLPPLRVSFGLQGLVFLFLLEILKIASRENTVVSDITIKEELIFGLPLVEMGFGELLRSGRWQRVVGHPIEGDFRLSAGPFALETIH